MWLRRLLPDRQWRAWLLLSMLLLVKAIPVYGAVSPLERMEGLVMPGEVIKKHARVEKQCSKCHEPFDRTRQSRLCMECHKMIAKDVKEKKGFHGHIQNIGERECRSCHTDHKGRDMDIIQLDTELFDHSSTDFKLLGAHRSVDCGSCHLKSGLYREGARFCHDCHQRDDIHKARMGKKCENCHMEGSWSPAHFDHEATKFRLRNAHAEVKCYQCHVNERYDGTPLNCYFCHFLDDVHEGDRGIRCQDCHQDRRWSEVLFDHDKDTDFSLKGQHTHLLCKDCHSGHIFEDEVKRTCYSCHELHDTHGGHYGKRCEMCHAEKSWTDIEFGHDRDTGFPLKGGHKDLDCVSCHKGKLFEEQTPKACIECHRLDDVHKGQEGERCETCHNDKGWRNQVVFDHDLTKFPLHESHTFLTCDDCHASGKFKEAKVVCVSCHRKDDVHEKRLGQVCDQCHHTSQWMAWEFDHTKQTKFPLEGAHDGLDCRACHKDVVVKEISLPKVCVGCHEKDDVHKGLLGRSCETCHFPQSFKTIKIQ